jgi:hypothetical protein
MSSSTVIVTVNALLLNRWTYTRLCPADDTESVTWSGMTLVVLP